MNFAHRLQLWGDKHHPKWLDLIRIVLGIFLCYKGFQFLNNMGELLDLMTNRLSFNAFAVTMLGHVVVFVHILGGFPSCTGSTYPFRMSYPDPYSHRRGIFCEQHQQFAFSYFRNMAGASCTRTAFCFFGCRKWCLVI